MAYTILEVSKQTGISPHTLRFWAKKGLFPFVERDSNGVKYFSQSDIEWVGWIDWFRRSNMSIEDIKQYVNLAMQGDSTAQERQRMIAIQHTIVLEKIKEFQAIAKSLEHKLDVYANMLSNGKDAMNPQSKDYVKCKKVCKKDTKKDKKRKSK
ncbi:transcriptional regulator [Helicobacter monodelphidis]|uniref:MerR family transcriptional regulator n=1 Tax=Helicobacter didelphidarum TaxID=2040648 RepID=A0A3D8IAA1_9HELI|nr:MULTISPECIES: MerR family transcriptional regulator [Helicobacter]RAX56787.1 transcriptional regulator [Helicobacter sp. 15-1451]RDU62067.1 MerR family transcriptional regulator [Helicobacter didelphidarum]